MNRGYRYRYSATPLVRHITPKKLSEFGANLIRDGASLIRNVAIKGGNVNERQSSPEPSSELLSLVNDNDLVPSDLSTDKKSKKQPKQTKTKVSKQTKTKQLKTKQTKTKVPSKQNLKQIKSKPIKKANFALKKKSPFKNIFDD